MCLVAKSIAPGPSSLSLSLAHPSLRPPSTEHINIIWVQNDLTLSLAPHAPALPAAAPTAGATYIYIRQSIVILFNNNNTESSEARRRKTTHFPLARRVASAFTYRLLDDLSVTERKLRRRQNSILILISCAFVLDSSELCDAAADGVSAFDICFAF